MRTPFRYILPTLALLFPALALAGSQSYTTPGTYTFTVPEYTGSLTVTVAGGGGGGGGGAAGANNFIGGNGGKAGNVSFGSITAYGGLGGCGGAVTNDYGYSNTVGARGVGDPVLLCSTPQGQLSGAMRITTGSGDGIATGGDINTTGGGAAGGGGGWAPINDGQNYGGGDIGSSYGSPGGAGGKSVKTYSVSQLAPGTTVTVVVGVGRNGGGLGAQRGGTPYNGGPGGAGGTLNDPSFDGPAPSGASGDNGGDGGVTITWTDGTPPPASQLSCSVTFDQNPLTGQSTTMRWTSTGADLFYINQVGWVGASGSAQVFQTGDYSGTVSGADATASCHAVLAGPDDVPDGGGSCTPASQTCQANGNLRDNCGNTTSCRYGCSTGTHRCNTTCQNTRICNASGAKVINSCGGSIVEDCSAGGLICSSGQCIPSSVGFRPFDATDINGKSFIATGHLQVAPSLVRQGTRVRVYWNVINASSCTVVGGNGDGTLGSGTGVWNTSASGPAGKTSSPITSQTVYTLFCRALSGAVPSTVQEQATVKVLSSFQEI